MHGNGEHEQKVSTDIGYDSDCQNGWAEFMSTMGKEREKKGYANKIL